MRQTILCIAASLLLLGATTGALALNALTDDQMTRVSGAAGITIAGPVDMLLTATSGTLDLSPGNDHTTRYLAITDGSDAGTAAISQDINVSAMKLVMNVVGDVDPGAATRTALKLDVYDWSGDVTVSMDRIESRRSGYANALLFGQTIGPASFLPNGANPSMSLTMAPKGSTGIAGELGMKLYIGYLDFAGPSNVINNGTVHGHELVFCENFPDKATKDAYDDGVAWDYDNWAASGQWLMGELVDGSDADTVAKPVSLDVFTTGGNTYVVLRVQGHYTRTVAYPDSRLSNMGSNMGNSSTQSGGINGTTGEWNKTKNYVLGEVRLKEVVGVMRNTTNTGWLAQRSIGGLALEDLSMEYTKMIISAAGTEPYFVQRQFSGGTMPTTANLGNTTELPGTVTRWDTAGGTRTVTWSTTY